MGKDLLPGNDFVEILKIDTLSVWSYTMYDDSVRSDNPANVYLGHLYDPYFGTTTAEFVSQVRLGSAWDPVNVTVDSVKLYMRLLDVKGGSTGTHTLELSEIDETIFTDSVYYSNKPVLLTGYNIANITLPQLKEDTVNDIVVNLPPSFGDYILRDTTKMFYKNAATDFRSYFKGFYFQLVSDFDPVIVTLSLSSPATSSAYSNYFVLFMHNEADLKKEYFLILDAVNKNAAFSKYSHFFNDASLDYMNDHINKGHTDTVSFLQSLNGVYTRIVLPGLEDLKNDPSFSKDIADKKIAINRARLTLPLHFDGDLYTSATAPSEMLLRYKTKSGYIYTVPDYFVDNSHAFFDGGIDATSTMYNFNLAFFVQVYLEDLENDIKPELELYQASGLKNALFRANGNSTPPKFELTYTKF